MRRARRLTVVEAVAAVAEAAADDTGAVAASALVPWVASAVVMLAALAEAMLAVSVEVTWLASAELARRAWAEVTMAMEGVISFAAALTATALIARITSNTAGHTPAPTERWANSEIADAQLSLSREPHI